MDSKNIKYIGIGLGVVVVSYIAYKLLKKKENKTVDNIVKDAFENLSFEFNSFNINPSSNPFLDELSYALKSQPSWKLELAGHTDNVGSNATNLSMSKGRVEAVKKYLVSSGISPDRIITYAFGESKPIASNNTEEGRSKNRRVEMKIIKSDGSEISIEDKKGLIKLENGTSSRDIKNNSISLSKGSPDIKKTDKTKLPLKTSSVNPNRSKAIKVNGVMIYVSDDNKGRLVFEDGGRKGEYKVNAKVSKFGVTLWSGSVSVSKIFKYPNGTIKIIDNTGKDFDGENTDLIPLVNQFKQGKSNLVASIGSANLNLQKMA